MGMLMINGARFCTALTWCQAHRQCYLMQCLGFRRSEQQGCEWTIPALEWCSRGLEDGHMGFYFEHMSNFLLKMLFKKDQLITGDAKARAKWSQCCDKRRDLHRKQLQGQIQMFTVVSMQCDLQAFSRCWPSHLLPTLQTYVSWAFLWMIEMFSLKH